MEERLSGSSKEQQTMEHIRSRDNTLRAAYAETLESDTQTDGAYICLPPNPNGDQDRQVARLKIKFMEYTRRVQSPRIEDSPFLPPEANVAAVLSDVYKRDVLRFVLEDGNVNTWALYRALVKTEGFVEPESFLTACGVIENYVVRDGQGNIFGTGLPNI